MIGIGFVAIALAGSEFSVSMDRYLACLGHGLPAGMSSQSLETRSRFYREAASKCEAERRDAINAAVRSRADGVTADAARTQAIDIIDTLDPMSSCKIPGAKC